ncbi:MAG: hypothetical protein LBL45_00280 [Treponema sp.]|nr:hypothetical protein [Treponema sp.]
MTIFKEVDDGSSPGLPLVISVDQDGGITVKTSALSGGNQETLEEFTNMGKSKMGGESDGA